MIKVKNLLRPFFAILVTFIVSIFVLAAYLHGPLQGEFRKFFLPAKMFGVPDKLKGHGISELFTDKVNSGWDGQFYYYISNDLFGGVDTTKHIDSNAYRYQRIGLPLLANMVAKITGNSWVSPEIYYFTSLSLILFATGMAAYFFQQRGIYYLWILPWSIWFGTQVTQLNGLPDAAADSLLIISLISLYQRLPWLYVPAMTLAILSREVYVLIPIAIMISISFSVFRNFTGNFYRSCISIINKISIHIVAPVIWLVWQIYIRYQFGLTPSSQATNILDWPFHSILLYFFKTISGEHPLVGSGYASYVEALSMLIYLAILYVAFLQIFFIFKNNFFKKNDDDATVTVGLSVGLIAVICIYLCFGSVVMMYRTGYLKAASLFIFIIPFLAAVSRKKIDEYAVMFLVTITFFSVFILKQWVNGPPYVSEKNVKWALREPACLRRYSAKVAPLLFEGNVSSTMIDRMLFHPSFTINTLLVNTSTEVFFPYQGKGSVNLSYQWLIADSKKVIIDGIRTLLPGSLKPREKIILPLRIKVPMSPGRYILRISPVQEGCSWFYLSDPRSSYDILYTI